LTSATGVEEEDCVDAAMSGIKGKRPLGDANEQRFNDRLQTNDGKWCCNSCWAVLQAADNPACPQHGNQCKRPAGASWARR